MKDIAGFLKRLIKMLCAGAFTIIVAACYGIPMDYRNTLSFLFHVKNPEDEPVPGLSVELVDAGDVIDFNWTDDFGDAYLYAYIDYYEESADYTVVVEDIDGTYNGGEFETVTMGVTGSTGNTSEYDITVFPVE